MKAVTNENNHKWIDFSNSVYQQLLVLSRDIFKPFIHIIFEPSFSDHTSLLLVVDNEKIDWNRIIWYKSLDATKFHDPIESLKYIGRIINPTLNEKNGEISIRDISHIIDAIKKINVVPQFESLRGFVLDGVNHTLIIGVTNNRTTYRWNYLPAGWSELQEIAGMLEDLHEKL